jgi:hypothetical protein
MVCACRSRHHRAKEAQMKPTLSTLASVIVIGALAMALPAVVTAQAERGRHRTLEGTWWVNVTILNDCVARKPVLSFPALLTFARGGTLTGTTTNPAFAVGQRTTDHGAWTWDGSAHKYKASTVALLLFTSNPNPPANPGFQAGSQTIDQAIHVTDQDHFTSDAVTKFFDTTGLKYRESCATAAGQRFE